MTAPHGPHGPHTLAREGIAALIPHAGTMCLLATMQSWDALRIVCTASNHRDAEHPLRTRRGLLAPCAIEYAAQAMALHGALIGQATGTPATPGYLASARGVKLPADGTYWICWGTRSISMVPTRKLQEGLAYDQIPLV